MYRRLIKPLCDRIAALLLLILLSPILLIIAILIKLESKGPVLFKQERIGFKGKVFRIYKFRSMIVGAERKGTGVYSGKGDPRVTKIGKLIRSTSLDELPQLLNIIKGEMSWIGPRPPLTYHPWPFEQYTRDQKHMFDALPGITGWAQVNGRKEVPWPERIELNNWYVDHISFMLDLKIALMTIFKVLSNADNANSKATATQTDQDNQTH